MCEDRKQGAAAPGGGKVFEHPLAGPCQLATDIH
jgi:hypothetical protein